MIVVKLELWKRGDPTNVEEIGRTYIANVGGTVERGDYEVAVCRRGNTAVPRNIFEASGISFEGIQDREGPVRRGSVNNYPRLSYNAWRLIIRALKSAFPEEA